MKQPEFSTPVEGERILPAKRERQPHEPYDDYIRRTNKWQWLRAGFACFGLHVGLTIFVYLITLVLLHDSPTGIKIVAGYALIGWLPFIKLYPVFMRKLE